MPGRLAPRHDHESEHPMSTPADELRAAVTQLRPSSPAVAAHTVAVRIPPAAADALADWLAKLADFCDGVERTHGKQPPTDNPSIVDALAVARAILNTGDQT